MRSFGPGRSCRIATWRPARPAASRTSCAVSACSSALPCEKFRRATSIPASTMRTSTSGSREAGPIVATIFVRRIIGERTVHASDRGQYVRMSIETEEELEGLRRAGRVVADVLRELRRRVQPGVRTDELDRVAGRVFARHGARSAPKLVYGAPSEVFISVNDAAVHGVPGPRRLRRGDLVKLDVTAELDGFYADACVTVACGPASPAARRLISAADAALRAVSPPPSPARRSAPQRGRRREAVARGVSVLDGLGGHGIGRTIHEEPSVPNAPDLADDHAAPRRPRHHDRADPRRRRPGDPSRAATAGRSARPTARSPPTPSTRSS